MADKDLISRQALLEEMEKWKQDDSYYAKLRSPVERWIRKTGISVLKLAVKKFPSIEAEPVRHGRWEEKFFTNDRQRVCSLCHFTVRQPSYDKGETALWNYCPNCGAKMDLEG